jgi:hypothetical protein
MQAATASSQVHKPTRWWREPDSNHRSRSCERLFWRCQSETAARKAEPLTGSGPKRQCLPGVAAQSLSLRGGTASSNPSSSSGESAANSVRNCEPFIGAGDVARHIGGKDRGKSAGLVHEPSPAAKRSPDTKKFPVFGVSIVDDAGDHAVRSQFRICNSYRAVSNGIGKAATDARSPPPGV